MTFLGLKLLTFYAVHLVSVVTNFVLITVNQSKVQREVENIHIEAEAELTNKDKDKIQQGQGSLKDKTLHK